MDADGVAFRAAAAVQKSILWDDDIATNHADLEEAKGAFDGLIQTYLDVIDDDARVLLCYSCPSRRYFRHDLYPEYKGHRSGSPPLLLPDLKKWSMEAYPDSRTKPGLEADDVLGILATHKTLVKGTKIIVSADKDLRQIPGLHVNALAPEDGVDRVSPDWADNFLWTQVLTGDVSDGYPGCPGIGAVNAARILAARRPDQERWEVVYPAYLKHYKEPEAATLAMETQVNVARILTARTYDFKKKEPRLWRKPSLPLPS